MGECILTRPREKVSGTATVSGLTRTTLWTNSATGRQGAGTASYSTLNNYSFVEVLYMIYENESSRPYYYLIPWTKSSITVGVGDSGGRRSMTINATSASWTNEANNNTYWAIPYKINGIKLTLTVTIS